MAFQQWNIRGLRSHRLNLHHLIYNYNPFIICLRETFLTYPPVPIPNYHFVSSPHSIAQSSILIHKKKLHTLAFPSKLLSLAPFSVSFSNDGSQLFQFTFPPLFLLLLTPLKLYFLNCNRPSLKPAISTAVTLSDVIPPKPLVVDH